MDLTERTIESKTMFQGRIITVLLDTAGLPDGGTAQREVVLHPGGVAVLALDEADNVALVRQYRYPLHGLLLELPAGKLDPGEDHRPAALRELSEETGLEAGDEDEFLDVVTMPFDTLVEQVMSGEITDAKTVATVLKVKTLLGR